MDWQLIWKIINIALLFALCIFLTIYLCVRHDDEDEIESPDNDNNVNSREP